jgi:uncharacterized protein (TIGR03083 family)
VTVPRLAYAEAAAAFGDVVDDIAPSEWSLAATDAWTVRELVGHTLRALITVEQYASAVPDGIVIDDATAYYRRALGSPGIHAQVAERGRQAGEALGDAPALVARTTVERVVSLVAGLPDGHPMATPFGGMRLIDYLPTRTVELVVHTLDLTDALGQEPRLPPRAAQLTIDLLAGIADRSGQADLLRALTGRRPLPPSYNVLG